MFKKAQNKLLLVTFYKIKIKNEKNLNLVLNIFTNYNLDKIK